MACEGINSWTLSELVSAFLDLSVACCLLCASAFSYLALKFLGLFGLSLPCSCDGLFWNPERNTHCHKKISLVHTAVRTKAPFETLFLDDQDNHHRDHELDNRDGGDRIVKFDPNSSIGLKEEEEGESGGAKGKRVVGRSIKYGLRRRRNLLSASSYDTLRSDARNLPRSPPSVAKLGNEVLEDAIDFEGKYREPSTDYGLEPNELGLKKTVKYTVRALEQALEEEQEARSALYVELEKERSAAGSAADEAMAMICRLQEEKASIEMEARQYHRMIEAKANYDAEEMNILKEILLRREREKHFLEKELEALREAMALEERDDRPENPLLVFEHELAIPELDEDHEADPDPPPPSFVLEPESLVHDIHVIDEESNSTIKPLRFGSSSFSSFENLSGSEVIGGGGLPLLAPPRGGHCRGKASKISELRRNSMSALDCERVKIDNEVERLRGRLRVVQEGRERLHFSAGHKEREKLQLQLLEDIAGQIREIRQLNDPGKAERQASLPPSYSKVNFFAFQDCIFIGYLFLFLFFI